MALSVAEKDLAFPIAEFEGRVAALQRAIGERGLDGVLVFGPHNIFYLTGYQTIGYSSFQLALVTTSDGPHLLVRDLERDAARRLGWMPWDPFTYADDEDPITALGRVVADRSIATSSIGIDRTSAFVTVSAHERIKALFERGDLRDSGRVIETLRTVKSPLEQEALRRAGTYAEAGMAAAIGAVRAGTMDNEVGAAAANALYAAGSEYVASGPTVTTGYRSGIAHTTFGRHRIDRGDVALIELGGVHKRYTTALMRTVAAGEPPAEARRMYSTCSRALDAAMAVMRPGAVSGDVHDAAQRVIDDDGFKEQFRKRLGYSVGISFAPGWGEGHFLELAHGGDTVLREGMVFHMPPALRRYARYGVGCSETVLVTADGVEPLTHLSRDFVVH